MSKIKVISGGQTGVDQAALRAAKRLGIPTGGWMPFGWTTEAGPRPDFEDLYGMVECQKPGYPVRTRANILNSDATIWLEPIGSRGYWSTLNAAARHGRTIHVLAFHADMQNWAGHILRRRVLSEWADASFVLNCAGNRESGNPGICERAEEFFLSLFEELDRQLV